MAPQFSNPTTVATVTATLPTKVNGWTITEQDVRSALAQVARDNGVDVADITVTLSQGPRTVTLTEDEYNALRAGGSA